MSRHRRHVIVAGSMPSSLPWTRWASTADASRLFAAAIACRSPVKCRLMSCPGTTWARPAPVPPPFAPNVGPTEGSRRQTRERAPMNPRPSVSEIAVVVLPSPDFVGVTAVTAISFPSGAAARRSSTERSIFALSRPYGSSSAAWMSRVAASSVISGSPSASRAIDIGHAQTVTSLGPTRTSVASPSVVRKSRRRRQRLRRCGCAGATVEQPVDRNHSRAVSPLRRVTRFALRPLISPR